MAKYEIIVYEKQLKGSLLSINEVSRFVKLHPDMIYRFFILGLIDPKHEKPDLLFEENVIGRINKIMRLKNDLGVNLTGCGLVIDLLDKIAEVEKRLQYYEKKYNR